jgi:hypothetical protein
MNGEWVKFRKEVVAIAYFKTLSRLSCGEMDENREHLHSG